MAKTLEEWISSDIQPFRERPLSWLSQYYFFRDPIRPVHIDPYYFFAPADGVIIYQQAVEAGDSLIDVGGRPYSLRDALRDPSYDQPSLAIGIFMTSLDVNVNRVPYAGWLSYHELDLIDTHNRPLLDFEVEILENLRIAPNSAEYLHHNQRVVNQVNTPRLGQSYYILQIADYDLDSIIPFAPKQNHYSRQSEQFSEIRYGSQVDLIIPLSARYDFVPLQEIGVHIEAGVDPLVQVRDK